MMQAQVRKYINIFLFVQNICTCVCIISGQKATKHKDADGEPSPRKSPKRSKNRGSRSSSKEYTPTHSGDPGGGKLYSSVEKPISPISQQSLQVTPKHESPSKDLSMDYDQKENIPQQSDSLSRTPPKNNATDNMDLFTPVKQIDSSISNHFPQATSTPAPNGIISTGQSNGHAFGKYI